MLARIFFIVLGIGFGCSLAQGPEFVQQYMQRLGGHVDELAQFVQRLDQDAAESEMTRREAVTAMAASDVPFVQKRGQDARIMIRRHTSLNSQQAALLGAGPFERIAVLARNYDSEIAVATVAAYRPAIPATAEGFLLGAVGFFFGYVFGEFLVGFGRMVFRRRMPVQATA